MHVCVHVCVHVRVCARMHVCVVYACVYFQCTHVDVHADVHIYTWLCVCVDMHVRTTGLITITDMNVHMQTSCTHAYTNTARQGVCI